MSTTIIDKPKVGTMPVAVPKKRPTTVQIQAVAKGVKASSAESADSYPSCLDLAADFLARG